MRITARDICTRVALSKLLIKIDQDPAYSKKLGVEDASLYRMDAACKKGKEKC